MTVWDEELHITSVRLQMGAYGYFSENLIRVSSSSNPGSKICARLLNNFKALKWRRGENIREAYLSVQSYCLPHCKQDIYLNDAFPIPDREGVLFLATYSFNVFNLAAHRWECNRLLVAYRSFISKRITCRNKIIESGAVSS